MRSLFILLSVLLSISPVSAFAQATPLAVGTASMQIETKKEDPAIAELANPRLVLDNFLKQMESYATGDENAVELAVQCLDLSEIPEFIRKEQGISLAVKLHSILSKTKIEFWKIPNKDTGTSFALRTEEQGQVGLEKSGPNWRFSKLTIRNIPELFFRLKDEKVLRDTTLAEPAAISQFSLRQFVPEFLNGRTLALEYWQIFGIVISFFIAWLVKISGFYFFRKITNSLVRKFQAFPATHSISSFVMPLAFLLAAFAYHFCLYMLDLDPVVYTSLLRILEIVKIIAVFVFLIKAVDLLAEILEVRPGRQHGSSTQILIPLLRTSAKFILFCIGLVLIADLFSINLTGLMAGLGIGGLALALAAKDTVENLFGSLTVLIDKPFKAGDFISMEGVSGVVENIGLRSTRLRTPENSLLTIPNSKLISVIVDNLGARKLFRSKLSLGITYETPVEKLKLFCEGIRQLLRLNPEVQPDYYVHLHQFADSSLNILIQAHFQASSAADHLAKQEDFFLGIIGLAESLGVEFAYPVQRHV